MKKLILASAFLCGVSAASAQVSASASDSYNDSYDAEKAFDGNFGTRWATTNDVAFPITLDWSYDAEKSVSKIKIDEWFDRETPRIKKFRIDYKKGKEWIKLTEGTTIGKDFQIALPQTVKAKDFRLTIMEGDRPTIKEIVLE